MSGWWMSLLKGFEECACDKVIYSRGILRLPAHVLDWLCCSDIGQRGGYQAPAATQVLADSEGRVRGNVKHPSGRGPVERRGLAGANSRLGRTYLGSLSATREYRADLFAFRKASWTPISQGGVQRGSR